MQELGETYGTPQGGVNCIGPYEFERWGSGQSITLDRVLLVADGTQTAVGRPHVAGATVSAEVVRLDRGDKVVAFKYRPKARRRVKKGHRQEQTVLRITDVVLNGKSAAAGVAAARAAADRPLVARGHRLHARPGPACKRRRPRPLLPAGRRLRRDARAVGDLPRFC